MKKKPKIDPIAIELTDLFVRAIQHKPMLCTTAFCIDLARSAIGWELANDVVMARKEIIKKIKKENFAAFADQKQIDKNRIRLTKLKRNCAKLNI